MHNSSSFLNFNFVSHDLSTADFFIWENQAHFAPQKTALLYGRSKQWERPKEFCKVLD